MNLMNSWGRIKFHLLIEIFNDVLVFSMFPSLKFQGGTDILILVFSTLIFWCIYQEFLITPTVQ